MDLTEAEDIKKRWQEYTEKIYPPQKILMTQISTKNPLPRASHPGM